MSERHPLSKPTGQYQVPLPKPRLILLPNSANPYHAVHPHHIRPPPTFGCPIAKKPFLSRRCGSSFLDEHCSANRARDTRPFISTPGLTSLFRMLSSPVAGFTQSATKIALQEKSSAKANDAVTRDCMAKAVTVSR